MQMHHSNDENLIRLLCIHIPYGNLLTKDLLILSSMTGHAFG